MVPILMHWIKVASITYIAVIREYIASLGMMKLVRVLVLGFCGFLNTELTIKSDEMEIPFSLIFFSFFFFLLTSKVVRLKPHQLDWRLQP